VSFWLLYVYTYGCTTSRCGQDSQWKCQSEWQRTEINGESTSMLWPTVGSRTAKDQIRYVYTQSGCNCSNVVHMVSSGRYWYFWVAAAAAVQLKVGDDRLTVCCDASVISRLIAVVGSWRTRAVVFLMIFFSQPPLRSCGGTTCIRLSIDIHCVSKKQDTKLLPITSPNVNRFSKFFHWQTHW